MRKIRKSLKENRRLTERKHHYYIVYDVVDEVRENLKYDYLDETLEDYVEGIVNEKIYDYDVIELGVDSGIVDISDIANEVYDDAFADVEVSIESGAYDSWAPSFVEELYEKTQAYVEDGDEIENAFQNAFEEVVYDAYDSDIIEAFQYYQKDDSFIIEDLVENVVNEVLEELDEQPQEVELSFKDIGIEVQEDAYGNIGYFNVNDEEIDMSLTAFFKFVNDLYDYEEGEVEGIDINLDRIYLLQDYYDKEVKDGKIKVRIDTITK